jgi:4-amino-4-deoxy-L-arabinose transferase-like glycosyltransferase
MARPPESLQTQRSHGVSYVLLAAAALACLLPFSSKAFNVDDTLFIDVARQITKHPLDPFGFRVNWFLDSVPIAYETKNPPLASYFIAAVASLIGWSERALHLAFLLPALAAVLGTYRLAQRFTKSPLLAAALTLLAPVFLVSATSVMCDTMTLALWIWAIIFWMEGLAPERPSYLATSASLITLCSLTKYFGIALIPLLAAYALLRHRRLGKWAWYLLIPLLALTGYQHWTKSVYGLRLITDAAHMSAGVRQARHASLLAQTLVDLSFVGGCMLPALTFAPILWRVKNTLAVCVASGIAAFLVSTGRIGLGEMLWPQQFYGHWLLVGVQMTFFIAAGFSVLALTLADTWKRRDADSWLLTLWIFGTFIFTGFLNWAINARSVLPMAPAAAILIARRIEELPPRLTRWRYAMLTVTLAVTGAVSLWLAAADTELANSARTAANMIEQKTRNQPATVWFLGHWGFQYYMERFGARAVIVQNPPQRPGDFLAVAENSRLFEMRPDFVASRDVIRIPMRLGITTAQGKLGAGFYSADTGPLPFAIGPVPAERYELIQLGRPAD